jgi:hypothetical protein
MRAYNLYWIHNSSVLYCLISFHILKHLPFGLHITSFAPFYVTLKYPSSSENYSELTTPYCFMAHFAKGNTNQ